MTLPILEWDATLAPETPNAQVQNVVEQEVRQFLAGYVGKTTTRHLIERLYPYAVGLTAHRNRSRLIKTLMVLAKKSLSDCCERGKPHIYMGKPAYPFLWFAPPPKLVLSCPHCGTMLEGYTKTT